MVMEYLDGESLSDRIKNAGRLSCQITARLVVDALEGLKAAHAAGIVHRDLKPDNIFLLTNKNGKRDFVKIVDFGISKFSSLGGEFSMTRTGAVMGTPYYLSPEQAKGERHLDHRADLYAIGVILYEAAAGRVPFDGETFNELLFKIVLEPVPPLSTYVTPVDPHFQAIVEKAMARDVNARFQSAEDMQAALAGWLEGQPPAPELMATLGGAATGSPRAAMGSQTGVANVTSHAATNAATQIGATNASWANTNSGPAANQNGSKKWIVAAVAGVLLAAVGGYVAMNASEASAEAASQAVADAEEKAESDKKHEQELARLEAEKARAEADRALADRARSEADKAAADAQLSIATKTEALEASARAATAAAAARPATTRRPAASPSPAPTPAPKPATSGRTIRTDL
jgi:serine/threonine-protein kinase